MVKLLFPASLSHHSQHQQVPGVGAEVTYCSSEARSFIQKEMLDYSFSAGL